MTIEKLKAYLDSHQIKYIVLRHSPAYTAQEIAAASHIPGREIAKTVMLRVDGKLAMAVLPASEHVDLAQFQDAIHAGKVALAHEHEFKDQFPDCEVGAMPPFGNLYGMEVYVADSLREDEEIAFNAGSHTELIRMPYETFEQLVKPKVVRFSTAEAY
jgi:Ala-tRNA(Pro) deacylase